MKWVNNDNRIPIKSWCGDVDAASMIQAVNLAEHPQTFHHVALMPDCHVGYGMPIGGVIACPEAVIPNAVGVDIGCGVMALETDCPVEEITETLLREWIRRVRMLIPVGFEHRKSPLEWEGWTRAPLRCPPIRQELESARRQLGTLGGGNHFIEAQASGGGALWLMIHSGSRNFGLQIAEHYHAAALAWCRAHKTELPASDLAYLPLDEEKAGDYLDAMNFALAFAAQNRQCMMDAAAEALCDLTGGNEIRRINVHHNYCALEKHFGRDVMVHRKGATSAVAGQPGIVPGSMGSASYIVRGRGAPESFNSCSHGAGRRMGRNEANRKLTLEECNRAMNGVVFESWQRDRKGRRDLSEAPPAYKDIDEVMAAQNDLVETAERLRPLAVIKG
jgi:tRNA-splicing ligase RtcB